MHRVNRKVAVLLLEILQALNIDLEVLLQVNKLLARLCLKHLDPVVLDHVEEVVDDRSLMLAYSLARSLAV